MELKSKYVIVSGAHGRVEGEPPTLRRYSVGSEIYLTQQEAENLGAQVMPAEDLQQPETPPAPDPGPEGSRPPEKKKAGRKRG